MRKVFQLDEQTHSRLKQYADITGVPMSKVVREAVADWMDTVGVARIESLTHKPVSEIKANFYRNVAETAERETAFSAATERYHKSCEEFQRSSDGVLEILDSVVPLKVLN